MRILAISGSLRANSTNAALLGAAGMLLPDGVDFGTYDGLGGLPHFNPDLDAEGSVPPPPVADLRARLREADGVVISSPEYAHGVAGSLKNGLDWVVGSGELVDKPVALLNASPRATIAQAALAETIRVMSARLVEGASIAVPVSGRGLVAAGIVADPALAGPIRAAMSAFVHAIISSHE